jgi:hypothetical protein
MSEASNPFVQQTIPATSPTSYIQPDMNYALRVWWAYYWPCACASIVLDFLYKNVLVSATPRHIRPVLNIPYGVTPLVLLSAYLLVTIFVMRYVLGKTFGNFRIALLTPDFASPQPLPITFARALQVWWFFTWRVFLYSLLGLMFVIYPLGMFVGLFNPTPMVSKLSLDILKFLMTAAISLYIIYSDILDEDMGDFHVALLPRTVPAEPLPFS